MQLATLDWMIVLVVLLLTLGIGALVSKRASRSSDSYFLAGRHMPWWLLGLSMVATTFSADTPNLVADIVRTQGVAGNWVWWSLLISGMLTAFVYAKLWRRLGVTTDVEFYEHRYSGKTAGFLRGFRALYLGLFFNVMIMANVTLAAVKIGTVLFGVSPQMVILVAGLVTVVFCSIGGFLGVLITDMMLFILAMAGAILAAYFAVTHPQVGGLDNLLSHANVVGKTSIIPDLTNPDVYVPLLAIPLLVQWWSVWYPGSEPGGGGYVAQRMLAAKNEHHSVAAAAFFNLCHFALRPWPWILVALASLVVYPDLASLQQALPQVPDAMVRDDLAYSAMLVFLPTGVLGLVVASLVSAYVSTISTSLNWGASYFVNDFYGRFLRPDASERRKVWVGRCVTLVLMVLAAGFAMMLESSLQAFRLQLTIGAGTGLLFLLRWFWLRINVYSEITAMVLSFVVSVFFEFGPYSELLGWQKMVFSVAITTLGWVSVTLLTPAETPETLASFKQRIQGAPKEVSLGLLAAVASTLGIYAVLMGIGACLYGEFLQAAGCLFVALITGVLTWCLYHKCWPGGSRIDKELPSVSAS